LAPSYVDNAHVITRFAIGGAHLPSSLLLDLSFVGSTASTTFKRNGGVDAGIDGTRTLALGQLPDAKESQLHLGGPVTAAAFICSSISPT
jgi:hypothetical protein